MLIRRETAGDEAAVRDVTTAAFGQSLEAGLVDDLRACGDAAVSLVAELNGEIVGHVLLPRLARPERAAALAPESVHPSHQRRGVGTALIRRALEEAQSLSLSLVFVVGNRAYYEAFGFSRALASGFQCEYSGPYFMALVLDDDARQSGDVRYADAFARLADVETRRRGA